MPMFQRRHYEAVAATLRREAGFLGTDQDQLIQTACGLASMFFKDNPRFDSERFFRAAIPQYVGPKVSISLSEIEAAQDFIKSLRG